ncbi:MAG: cytochrome c [Flavipsychrobacter sp.]
MRQLIACGALLLVSCGNAESSSNSTSEEKKAVPVYDYGKELYTQNCTQCHIVNKDMIGPALKGALARWDNDTVALRSFVKNSTMAITSGNPRAVEVYNKWNKAMMTPMPHLTDEDIDAILDYVERAE